MGKVSGASRLAGREVCCLVPTCLGLVEGLEFAVSVIAFAVVAERMALGLDP